MTELNTITLADIERQILLHQQAVRDLCEVAIRLDEAAHMSGAMALKWLLGHGYRSDTDARKLIAQVIQERRATQDASIDTPLDQATTDIARSSSPGGAP